MKNKKVVIIPKPESLMLLTQVVVLEDETVLIEKLLQDGIDHINNIDNVPRVHGSLEFINGLYQGQIDPTGLATINKLIDSTVTELIDIMSKYGLLRKILFVIKYDKRKIDLETYDSF